MDQKEPSGHRQRDDRRRRRLREPTRRAPTAFPATPALTGSESEGYTLRTPIATGGTALLLLTRIPPEDVPGATQAVQPEPLQGGITGVVWRDFKPGGARSARSRPRSSACPGSPWNCSTATERRRARRRPRTTGASRSRTSIRRVSREDRRADVPEAFEGIAWLGPSLITPAAMIAYIWVWAGFSMVVIAAGLPRSRATRSKQHGPTVRRSGRSSAASPCRCSRPCSASSSSRC